MTHETTTVTTEKTEVLSIYLAESLGATRVQHGTEFTVGVSGGRDREYSRYRFGSVAGYALENFRDARESFARAEKNGHPVKWINPDAAILSDTPEEQGPTIALRINSIVWFEGETFRIEPAPNGNLYLIPVTMFTDGTIRATARPHSPRA